MEISKPRLANDSTEGEECDGIIGVSIVTANLNFE